MVAWAEAAEDSKRIVALPGNNVWPYAVVKLTPSVSWHSSAILQELTENKKHMRNYNYALELGGSSLVLEKTWGTCYVDKPACSREVSRPPLASDITNKLIVI